ncbi:unnamed protein product [Caenorhabditis sp. 36 PRJEB53466]|nr:unnamed protein product [Caenorhabditis sp. 36 PRJEB53466]
MDPLAALPHDSPPPYSQIDGPSAVAVGSQLFSRIYSDSSKVCGAKSFLMIYSGFLALFLPMLIHFANFHVGSPHDFSWLNIGIVALQLIVFVNAYRQNRIALLHLQCFICVLSLFCLSGPVAFLSILASFKRAEYPHLARELMLVIVSSICLILGVFQTIIIECLYVKLERAREIDGIVA